MRDLVVRSLIRMNKREAEWDKQARNGEMNLRKTMREELAQIREKNWWTSFSKQNKTGSQRAYYCTVLCCCTAVLLYCCNCRSNWWWTCGRVCGVPVRWTKFRTSLMNIMMDKSRLSDPVCFPMSGTCIQILWIRNRIRNRIRIRILCTNMAKSALKNKL